ncbi:MAG: hypothetical protein DMF64_19720 [Acidobacteria bacterium]|nr:MAG: hypothetical protein DMF64_19720 [Acidobacteriota bacterium]
MKVATASFIMARQKLQNYLRTHRKRSGLSQKEVGFLLGCKSSAKVSRYERFSRQPTLKNVFAYELIFGTPARELFAGVFQCVEEETLHRVQLLSHKLQQAKLNQRAKRKLEFLHAITESSIKHDYHV